MPDTSVVVAFMSRLALPRHAFREYRRRGVRLVELGVDVGNVTGGPGCA